MSQSVDHFKQLSREDLISMIIKQQNTLADDNHFQRHDKGSRVQTIGGSVGKSTSDGLTSGQFVCHWSGCGKRFTSIADMCPHKPFDPSTAGDDDRVDSISGYGNQSHDNQRLSIKEELLSDIDSIDVIIAGSVDGNDGTISQSLDRESSVKSDMDCKRKGRKKVPKTDGKYVCDYKECLKFYYTRGALRAHQRSHSDQTFFCDSDGCSQHFRNWSLLKMHLFTDKHVLGQPFQCDRNGCDYKSESKDQFVDHMSGHTRTEKQEQPLVDSTPAKNTSAQVDSPMLAGKGQSRNAKVLPKCTYMCNYMRCGLTFHDLQVLHEHQRSHTDQPMACGIANCGLQFPNWYELIQHMAANKHAMAQDYRCSRDSCMFVTTSQERLTQHLTNHVTVRTGQRFACDRKDCSQSFRNKRHLLHHKSTNCGRPYRCDAANCTAAYKLAAHLERHTLRKHAQKEYQCSSEGCSHVFKARHQLYLHTVMTHPDAAHPDKPWLHCTHTGCQFRTKLKSQLSIHTDRHTRPYVCTHCGKGFTCNRDLKGHLATHDQSLRIPCEWPGCEMSFPRQYYLKAHMNTHTAEIVYRCQWPGCGKEFLKTGSRNKHERNIHGMGTDSIAYRCERDGCEKSFKNKTNLKFHEKYVHLGKRRVQHLQCQWSDCQYVTTSAALLRAHIDSHKGF